MMRRREVLTLAAVALTGPAAAHEFIVPDASADHTALLQSAMDNAAQAGVLPLGAGVFNVSTLRVAGPMTITGIVGRTILKSASDVLLTASGDDVSIVGLTFATDNAKAALVSATQCRSLRIRDCRFDGGARGLALVGCSGEVSSNFCRNQSGTGIFNLDSKGLLISGNTVEDIANNGIQVWRSEKGEDGSQVVNNHIARIRTEAGGDGQNGNGINVFRAGNVVVSGNRITDCAFSAIRDNSGSNVIITGNSASRCGEVAIFVEFAYQGAVVSNNVIEETGDGISITNYDTDGRLAVCAGNVIRKVKGIPDYTITRGIGIIAEADVTISGNMIEDVRSLGMQLGWGKYGRNLVAQGNVLRDCDVGIAVSVVDGMGAVEVSGNIIDSSRTTAIQGFDHATPVTDDWGKGATAPPAHVTLDGNIIR